MLTRDELHSELAASIHKIDLAAYISDRDDTLALLEKLIEILPKPAPVPNPNPNLERGPAFVDPAPIVPQNNSIFGNTDLGSRIRNFLTRTIRNPAPQQVAPPPPPPAPPVVDKATLIKRKTDLLRNRLINIIGHEQSDNQSSKQLCDNAFALQITLARAFPSNDVDEDGWLDPISMIAVEDPIFFSSGLMISKESLMTFYNTKAAFRNGNFITIHNAPLSQREIISLQCQGVIPPQIEMQSKRIAGGIGWMLGFGALCGFILFCFPAAAFAPCFTGAFLASIVDYIFEINDGVSFLFNFVGLYVSLAITLTLAAVTFPPLVSLLAAHALISQAAATVAFNIFSSLVFPVIIPAILLTGASILRYTRQIPIGMITLIYNMFPVLLIQALCESAGSVVGKALSTIEKFFNNGRLRDLPPFAPTIPFNNAMVGPNEDNSSIHLPPNSTIVIHHNINSGQPLREALAQAVVVEMKEEKEEKHVIETSQKRNVASESDEVAEEYKHFSCRAM